MTHAPFLRNYYCICQKESFLRQGFRRTSISSSKVSVKHTHSEVYRYLSLIAFALIIPFSVEASAVTENINICENVADYVFVTDITDCTKYFICVNQTAIAQQCENNLFFDAKSQSCQASSTTCLSCDANKLTFHALAKTCNKYVVCFGGNQVIKRCCDNLQFNPAIGQCDLPQNVDCVENRCNIFDDPKDIKHVASLAACEKYYICMNGNPIAQTCAKTLQFNPNCNCCDLASNVKCPIKATPRGTTHSFRSPATFVNDKVCPTTGIHFFPHANADSYYMCSAGKGVILSCADGLVYDEEYSSCREPKLIRRNKKISLKF